MEILLLIVLGALAGWVASMIMKTNEGMGSLANIIVGVAGAFIGSFLFHVFGGAGVTGFNIYSFLVALVGSVVLLAVVRLIRGREGL